MPQKELAVVKPIRGSGARLTLRLINHQRLLKILRRIAGCAYTFLRVRGAGQREALQPWVLDLFGKLGGRLITAQSSPSFFRRSIRIGNFHKRRDDELAFAGVLSRVFRDDLQVRMIVPRCGLRFAPLFERLPEVKLRIGLHRVRRMQNELRLYAFLGV